MVYLTLIALGLCAPRIPFILFARYSGSSHTAFWAATVFSRNPGSPHLFLDLKPCFTRWSGESHRFRNFSSCLARSRDVFHTTLLARHIFAFAVSSCFFTLREPAIRHVLY